MVILVLSFILKTAIAAALGGFLALERRMAGGKNDLLVHAWAGGIAALLGAGAISTGAQGLDFVVVSGVLALAIGALTRDFAVAWAARARSGTTTGAAASALAKVDAQVDAQVDAKVDAKVDLLSFTGVLWAGACCGFGDARGCIFVVLILAIVAMFRPREAMREAAAVERRVSSPVQEFHRGARREAAKAVDASAAATPALNPPAARQRGGAMVERRSPAGLQDAMSTPALADAAERLAALAAALRGTAQRNRAARAVFDQITAPAAQPLPASGHGLARTRQRDRLPPHGVASRNGGSRPCAPASRKPVLQRANFRPVSP